MKLIYSTYLDIRTNSSTNEFLIQWNFLVPFLQNNRIHHRIITSSTRDGFIFLTRQLVHPINFPDRWVSFSYARQKRRGEARCNEKAIYTLAIIQCLILND